MNPSNLFCKARPSKTNSRNQKQNGLFMILQCNMTLSTNSKSRKLFLRLFRNSRSTIKWTNHGRNCKHWLQKVLQKLEESTRFPEASFLETKARKSFLKTLIELWASTYNKVSSRNLADQDSNFNSLLAHLAYSQRLHVEDAAIKSRNGLMIWEHFLQQYRKKFVYHPRAEPALAPAVSVKALNDRFGGEGIITSALVSGDFLRPYYQSE